MAMAGDRYRIYGARDAALAKAGAGYGHCPECNALPNNPCRERDPVGRRRFLNKPHPVRPKTDSEGQ